MAKQPRVSDSTPEALPSAGAAGSLLNADERLSPLFKSLRDIDAIDDADERLRAALERLDAISKLALSRSRLSGSGVINDPDCHAAVKVEEVAHRLLSIEPRPRKPRAPELSVFDQPLALVKGNK